MNAHEASNTFGYFAPPSWSQRLFNYVPKATRQNRHLGSIVRRLAQIATNDRVDLATQQCGNVRLYPKDNASDRWLIKGYPMVDSEELAAIEDAMKGLNRPGVFYDIGANSGLYSLSLLTSMRANGAQEAPIIKAFEPNPIMIARLRENLNFNQAVTVEIVPIGLSGQTGTLRLDTSTQNNLGEATLIAADAESDSFVSIPTSTLNDYIELNNAPTPDAMKLDIEGHEIKVLSAFFRESPDIRPALITCEMWSKNSDALKYCLAEGGYNFVGQPGDNAIFRHESSK